MLALTSMLLSSGLMSEPGDFAATLSPEAAHVMAGAIASGCAGKAGAFTARGVVETDLTGDGRADLMIDHSALLCGEPVAAATGAAIEPEKSPRSTLCDSRTCTVILYVRDDTGLSPAREEMSIGSAITHGAIPGIALTRHDYSQYTLRWDGTAFK